MRRIADIREALASEFHELGYAVHPTPPGSVGTLPAIMLGSTTVEPSVQGIGAGESGRMTIWVLVNMNDDSWAERAENVAFEVVEHIETLTSGLEGIDVAVGWETYGDLSNITIGGQEFGAATVTAALEI